jgi:hypothetical protein
MKPRVAGSNPAGRELFSIPFLIPFLMVDVAQLVELRIVIPVVVGSSPIVHPIFKFNSAAVFPACFLKLKLWTPICNILLNPFLIHAVFPI